MPWVEAVFAEPNPAPIKAALALRRKIANELRAPMTVASRAHTELMSRLVEQLARATPRQPPVTGGKKATSAPSVKTVVSSHITWFSAIRTVLPRARLCA